MTLETREDTDRGFRSTSCLAKLLQTEEVKAFVLACEPAAIKLTLIGGLTRFFPP